MPGTASAAPLFCQLDFWGKNLRKTSNLGKNFAKDDSFGRNWQNIMEFG